MAGNFGDLLKQAGFKASETDEAPTAQAEPTEEDVAYGPKVVVRFSKRGRGGKTVTLVSGVTSGLVGLAAGNYLGLMVAYMVKYLVGQ